MRLPLAEPIAPRYIHINPVTNKVHLLVPVVGGQEISTDNTCKATVALREFFDGGALNELNAYKRALEFDVELLKEGNIQRAAKEERLAQIEAYLEAVAAMNYSYGETLTAFLAKPSNLYSIQLRPRAQDSLSQVVNPAFNIARQNDASGTPLSALYRAMYAFFPHVRIALPDPRSALITAVLGALTPSPKFEEIVHVLKVQCKERLGVDIEFTNYIKRMGHKVIKYTVNQEHLDDLMGYGEENPATAEDYINALLGTCAPDLWGTLPMPTSPFYSIPATIDVADKTEQLSIITQFFLANLNVYCKAKKLSTQNFGVILDASPELSGSLAQVVSTALSKGYNVEKAIFTFCNKHIHEFGLSRAINAQEVAVIQRRFERIYRTVTATRENPHMDDFMILDNEARESASFVSYQGAICVNFAQIIDPVAASANPDYFSLICVDFAARPLEIPHQNEWVSGDVDIEHEALVKLINSAQFEQFPEVFKVACYAHPCFQARQFLPDVAQGKQYEVDTLLSKMPDYAQILLQTPGVFTDYSDRTFHCTAYEYAYWAKDTHMCRMLEKYMNEETKSQLLARIDEMERIDITTGKPVGLEYLQHGEVHRSTHFNFAPLKQALQNYVDGYDAGNEDAIHTAWMNVGKAQYDTPVHVLQEYCRLDRPFAPKPQFNEEFLPRITPLDFGVIDPDDSSGVGIDFALIRGSLQKCQAAIAPDVEQVILDLAAITHLDEVRTVDLKLSYDYLKPPESSYCLMM